MPVTKFETAGVDLDTLFEPIGATTKRADISFSLTNADLSNYYADAALGTAYGTVNFSAGGSDLGALFAAIGTVNTTPQPGILYSWGGGQFGQLGDNTTITKSSPVVIGSFSWIAISAGNSHKAAIRSDYKLFTWGGNGYGQLGDGTAATINRVSPIQIGSSSWIAVAAGGAFTAAIRSDYKLFTWGGNSFGQLGDGTIVAKSSPVQIGTSSWTAVSAALGGIAYFNHTSAIRSDGALFQWGANSRGQLATGDTSSRSSPVQVGASSWTAVSNGNDHTIAITADKRLFAWGRGEEGELGIGAAGTGSTNVSPVQVGTSSWTAVSAGLLHSTAIRSDRLLFTWGSNGSGQLGDGTTVNKSSPVQIGSSSWRTLSAGGNHTAAIRSDYKLFTWGSNGSGQLGDGTTTSTSSPVQVGASSWTAVAAGVNHTGALRSI